MQAHFGKEKALQIAVGPILVVLVVPSSDVSHITIQDGVVKLFTLKGETHLLALTLDQAEKELDPQRFMRVNRQFILDNQWAFKYGAQQGFGMRDDRFEEGEEVSARKTIEDSIDGEKAETSRIVLVGWECFYLEQPLEISTSLSFRSGGPHSTRGGRGSPGTSREGPVFPAGTFRGCPRGRRKRSRR